MSLFSFFKRDSREKNPVREKRRFAGAKISRLSYDWKTTLMSADEILKLDLRTLRARSRDLAINNEYIKKFVKSMVVNVVGQGIGLQMKAKFVNGKLDINSNSIIEKAWKRFKKARNCTITENLDFESLLRLIIETIVKDGEIFIRKVPFHNNEFGFSLQLLEADYLDEGYNYEYPDGRYIRMGIEHNRFGKVLAYHISQHYPTMNSYTKNRKTYVRVPADEIIHLFVKERPSQSRGIPWCHAVMVTIHNAGAYTEAEIVASRAASSKMGFLESENAFQYQGDDVDADGNIISEFEPGTIEKLPPGVRFASFDPTHPSGNYDTFMRRILRGVGSGLSMNYISLANDLSEANYNSLRAGLLEDRDYYRVIQSWIIENFCMEVFEDFLRYGLLSGVIPLRYDNFSRLNEPRFQPRGWQWVDPLKDMNAAVIAVSNKLKSRQDVVTEYGKDFEEIAEELAHEQEIIATYGMNGNTGKIEQGGGQDGTEEPAA